MNETAGSSRGRMVSMLCILFLCMLIWSPAVLDASWFGMKVGVQRLKDQGNTFRFRLGLYYSFNLGKDFSLQPELYLTQYQYNYGGIVYGNTVNDGKEIRFFDKLRYLEAPLLLKYRVPLKGDLRPVVLAGVYGALRLSEQRTRLDTAQLNNLWWAEIGIPLTREYPALEGGLVAGLGIEHGSGNTRMVFDVRLNIGLTRLVEVFNMALEGSAAEGELYRYSQRNHSLIFTVGIGF